MKKSFIPLVAGLLAMTLLTGCLELHRIRLTGHIR